MPWQVIAWFMSYLTFFLPMFPFDPPENIRKPNIFYPRTGPYQGVRNVRFSDVFTGDQKGTLGRKGLRDIGIDCCNFYFTFYIFKSAIKIYILVRIIMRKTKNWVCLDKKLGHSWNSVTKCPASIIDGLHRSLGLFQIKSHMCKRNVY